MAETKKDELLHDQNHDGIDRRGFLKCTAWTGTGAFCVMKGGVLQSYSLSRPAEQLRSLLGVTDVNYVRGRHALAVVGSTLG